MALPPLLGLPPYSSRLQYHLQQLLCGNLVIVADAMGAAARVADFPIAVVVADSARAGFAVVVVIAGIVIAQTFVAVVAVIPSVDVSAAFLIAVVEAAAVAKVLVCPLLYFMLVHFCTQTGPFLSEDQCTPLAVFHRQYLLLCSHRYDS